MTFISQTSTARSTPDILVPDVDCDASVVAGDWVRFNASNIAIKALANNIVNSNVVGLVEEKTGTTKCTIRVAGVSKELFTGLDVTKQYFLDTVTAGAMTLTVASGSGEIILSVGKPFDSKRFLVQPLLRLQRAV